MVNRGLVHIYTGNGKGKTTAAVGLSVRAVSYNLKVCYIYFHKDPEMWGYGEIKVLSGLGIDVYGFATKHPHFYSSVRNEDVRAECLKGLNFVKNIYKNIEYDLLILDEINISIRDGYLSEDEVIELIDDKPLKLELVLTGRNATKRLIEKADLVSEIIEIKHPYNEGVLGRRGFEY
jgi:cob(I)alamin adenosyltransferase